MQKPVSLTTFGRSDCDNNIYQKNTVLTPDLNGQFITERSGKGHRLL
jgi:hypothetical protein